MKTALLAAIALVGPLVLGLAASAAYKPFGRPYFSVQEGRRAFQGRCAQCHSDRPGSGSNLGPSLARIGQEAAARRPGMSATEYLVESIVNPGAFRANRNGQMPGGIAELLSVREIRGLAAYLASLGGTPDYDAIASIDVAALRPPDDGAKNVHLDLAQIERGRQLFLGRAQCVHCHGVRRSTESRLTAPPTPDLALYGEQYLKESIKNPSAVIADHYKQHTVVTPDGRTHVGRIMRKDDKVLVLLTVDGAGQLRPLFFELAGDGSGDGVQVVTSSKSPMPEAPLTDEEVDDLVAFLMSISTT